MGRGPARSGIPGTRLPHRFAAPRAPAAPRPGRGRRGAGPEGLNREAPGAGGGATRDRRRSAGATVRAGGTPRETPAGALGPGPGGRGRGAPRAGGGPDFCFPSPGSPSPAPRPPSPRGRGSWRSPPRVGAGGKPEVPAREMRPRSGARVFCPAVSGKDWCAALGGVVQVWFVPALPAAGGGGRGRVGCWSARAPAAQAMRQTS